MNYWDDTHHNDDQGKWSDWTMHPKKQSRPLLDYFPTLAFAASAVIILAVLIF